MSTLTPEQLVIEVGELYSLPAVAMEVLALADDPSRDAAELKRAFEHDPALSAKVLRVVNSSLFGLAHPVSNLNQAIAMLGMRPLKLLVLGFTLPHAVARGIETESLQQYWKFTLTKAVIAREVSDRLRPNSGDDAFLAGLLADLGLLVLIQRLGEPYVHVFHRVRSAQRDLREVERHVLGFDHVQLTVHLLDHWGLPRQLAEAISASIEPVADAEENQPSTVAHLGRVLRFADLATQFLCQRQADLFPQMQSMAVEEFRLSPQELAELIESLEANVQHLAESLSLELPLELRYLDVLAEAHRQLAEVAAEVAGQMVRPATMPSADELVLWNEVRHLAQLASDGSLLGDPASVPSDASRVAWLAHAPGPASLRGSRFEPAADSQSPPVSANRELAADAELLATLEKAVKVCRKTRRPLSLLLVEADPAKPGVHQNVAARAKLLVELEALCRAADHAGKIFVSLRPERSAIVLLDSDRAKAVELAGDLLQQVRQLAPGAVRPTFSVSLGTATVPQAPPNFVAGSLVEAALRCLHAAQVGGNSLKSIEIL